MNITVTTETRRISFEPVADIRYLSDDELDSSAKDETLVTIIHIDAEEEWNNLNLEWIRDDVYSKDCFWGCSSHRPGNYESDCDDCAKVRDEKGGLIADICRGVREHVTEMLGEDYASNGHNQFISGGIDNKVYVITEGIYAGAYIRRYPGYWTLYGSQVEKTGEFNTPLIMSRPEKS